MVERFIDADLAKARDTTAIADSDSTIRDAGFQELSTSECREHATNRGRCAMDAISRQQAIDLIRDREDLVVLETLEEKYYRKFHLPGAVCVPLDEDFDEQVRQVAPHKSVPILVYCLDSECEASANAARRLVELGYAEVYDYEAGKVDWKEAGLPIEERERASR